MATRKSKPKRNVSVKAIGIDSDLGVIRISEDVIAAIVKRYAMSVPGVSSLGGQSMIGGLADIFGKRIADRSIMVDLDHDKVNIAVTVVVMFGEHVPTVAMNIQNICRKYVEELTGQEVGRVDVIVHNLDTSEFEDDEFETDEAELLEGS